VAGDRKKFQVAMTHAQRFREQEDWTGAAKAYRFALAEFPNDQAAIIGFGQASLSAGKVDLARKAFQQALRLNPSNFQVLHYMAEIQEQMGQLDEAAETHLRVGNILASQNDLDTAIESWMFALNLVPDHVDAHHKLAQGLASQGKSREAARQFLTLGAIYQRRDNPDQTKTQIQEARALIGDEPGITAALDALAQGVAIDPDLIGDMPPPADPADTDRMFDLSDFTQTYHEDDLFEDEGDPFALWEEQEEQPQGGLIEFAQQNALTELANVVFEEDDAGAFTTTIPRDELNMLIIQAVDFQTQDDLPQAVDNYRQVVKAGMSNGAVLFNLGLLSKEVGQYDEAAKMLKASAQSENYGLPSHFALGQTYHAVGDLETALRHFIEAVKLVDTATIDQLKAREVAQHYETLADNYLAEGDEKKITAFINSLEGFFSRPDWENKVFEARQRMDSVAENGSGMTLAEYLETVETEVVITSLAMTQEYMRRNLLMTASEECLQAIQKVPSSLLLHVRLADILIKQDQSDAAITKYLTVAKVYLIRNQLDKAINIYQKILRLAPMDVTVRSKLIDLYISSKNIEQALDEYLILANSYYQLAQVDRALEKYNEALRLTTSLENADPWKVEILGQIGDIYNQRFDWTRAATAFEELLQINPHDERILRQQVDLYFKQRKMDQAIEVLDRLLNVYQQREQPELPLDLLKELVVNYPEEMYLRQKLAEAYIQNRMKQSAIAELDALGEMQLEKGLRGEATRTIETILELQPEDVEGYRRLLAQIGGGA